MVMESAVSDSDEARAELVAQLHDWYMIPNSRNEVEFLDEFLARPELVLKAMGATWRDGTWVFPPV